MSLGNKRVRIISGSVDLRQLQAANKNRYPYLLQSVANASESNRFDILFAFPQQTLELHSLSQLSGPYSDHRLDFLQALNDWFEAEKKAKDNALSLPFTGGWFIYLGYELAQQIEPTLNLPASDTGFPIAFATRCPAAFIVDKIAGKTFLVCEQEDQNYIRLMEDDLNRNHTVEVTPLSINCNPGIILEADSADYLSGVGKIKEWIREGDVFQVNFSRQWIAKLDKGLSSAIIYNNLCQHNAAPFAGLVYWRKGAIISSSPERLVECRGQKIQTRPIAGTRPRSKNKVVDEGYANELMAHPKEQAEHIMLVDLERNDLGKVCKPGSIVVDELLVLESYPHVHHIVSNIVGTLQDDLSPSDVIRAVFPGGTITGCPKIRCMQIIAELEKVPRGYYTGSMGYIDTNGDMDLNILIRTLFKNGDQVLLRAGAGIVYDSVAESELEETRAKARGLLCALADTQSRSSQQ